MHCNLVKSDEFENDMILTCTVYDPLLHSYNNDNNNNFNNNNDNNGNYNQNNILMIGSDL